MRHSLLVRITHWLIALFPLIVVTGLAMSPAVTSVVPWIATMFGGHQSARTIYFLAASAKGIGKGLGGGAPEAGHSWYAGI